MRNPMVHRSLISVLCAGALMVAGCGSGAQPQAGQAASGGVTAGQPQAQNAAAPQAPQGVPGSAGQPQGNELRPEAQSVSVGQTAAGAGAYQGGQGPQPGVPLPENRPTAPEPAELAAARPVGQGAERGAAAPVAVPAGTRFRVELESGLASNGSVAGDRFRARVIGPVLERGLVVIPAGSEVAGDVTQAVSTGRLGGRARLGLRFTELILPSGVTVPIHASFAEEGRSKARRSAATIGGAAAGGALLGQLLNHHTKGTVIGALAGGAVGTAIAANAPGQEVVIPRGAVIRLRLSEPVIL